MIYINDKAFDFLEDESLKKALIRADFDPDFVACEVNENLVKREEFELFILEDKANIEVFSMVGGGWWILEKKFYKGKMII